MIHIQNDKYPIFTRLVNLVLPLSPILQTYGWGRYDFSFIITGLLAIVWFIFYHGSKYVRPKWFSIYLYYFLLIQILSITTISSIIPLGWLRIFLVYGLFFSQIKYSLFIRYYLRITIICLSFWYVQYFSLIFLGTKIPGIFTSLPLALGVTDINTYIDNLHSAETRSCSFFSEPALFVQYLLPIMIVVLFRKDIKAKWAFICATTLCLLLLRSGNALIGLSIIIVGYSIWKIHVSGSIKKTFLLMFIPLSVFIGGYFYINSEIGQKTLYRQDQLNNNLSTVRSGQSGFVRIYRGYSVYQELSPIKQIIGANNPAIIKDAIDQSNVSSLFMENDFYFNTFQTVLIRTGIIGLIIISIFFGKLFIETTSVGKVSLVTLFVLGFIASMYFTELMFIYISIAYYNKKRTHIS